MPAGQTPRNRCRYEGQRLRNRAYNYTANEPWRQHNAALIEMTLRGTPFIYYGEEVGLRPGTQIVVDDRDYARTPMTWSAAGAGHGFTTGKPWIGFGALPEQSSIDTEDADPSSTLTFYRQLLAFRRGHEVWGTGDVRRVALDIASVVAYVRENATERYLVAVNLTDSDQEGTAQDPLPSGGDVVFGDGTLDVSDGTVHVKIPASTGAVFAITAK